MRKLKYLKGDIEPHKLDRIPFGFHHSLAEHPALKIESLSKLLVEMPQEKVMFSKGSSNVAVNLDKMFNEDKKKFDLNEIIETIRTGESYIAVRSPELHESFHELFKDLMDDVGELLKENKKGTAPIQPHMWLFIASPNAVTPFHIDRSSNFILQIRGSKELAVFPPHHEGVFRKETTERYMDWDGELPVYSESFDHLAHKFNFKSGEAAHIPFTSGHYVKNGPEDISITISIFFHSDETLKWSEAMKLNNRLRRAGIKTRPVGQSPIVDSLKAGLFPAVEGAFSVARKLRGN